ncbi:MAG: hypothetical protein ACOYM5_02880 [Caulobacter sp.]
MSGDGNGQAEIQRLKAQLAALEARGAGAPPPQAGSAKPQTGLIFVVVVAVILLLWAAIVVPGRTSVATGSGAPAGGAGQTDADRFAAAAAAREEQWEYAGASDPMGTGRSDWACRLSVADVSLNSPYPDQRVRLCLRKSTRHGDDIYVTLPEGGQFICRVYNGCTVRVRFDDGPATAWTALEASDGSSNILFLRGASRFFTRVRGTKRVLIEAEFYEAGVQTMEWSTADLHLENLTLGR